MKYEAIIDHLVANPKATILLDFPDTVSTKKAANAARSGCHRAKEVHNRAMAMLDEPLWSESIKIEVRGKQLALSLGSTRSIPFTLSVAPSPEASSTETPSEED